MAATALALACGDATSVAATGPGAREQAIVNGHLCAPGEDESTGLLVTHFRAGTPPTRFRASCTGSLIAPDAVLTAAHCVDARHLGSAAGDDAIAADISTTVEFTDSRDALPIDVVRTVIHPDYDPDESLSPDLAVLFLARAPAVRPAVLARREELAVIGTLASIVGYGVFDPDIPAHSPPDKHCGDTWLVNLWAGYLIAGQDLTRSKASSGCFGDSGGPLFVTEESPDGPAPRLLGVASRGDPECTSGMYVRMDVYAPWVDEQLRPDVQRAAFKPPAPTLRPEEELAAAGDSPTAGCAQAGGAGWEWIALGAMALGRLFRRRA